MKQLISFTLGAALVASAMVACAPAKSKKDEVIKGNPTATAVDGSSLKIESISSPTVRADEGWGSYSIVNVKFTFNGKTYEKELSQMVSYPTEQEKINVSTHSIEIFSNCATANCERFDVLFTVKNGSQSVAQLACRSRGSVKNCSQISPHITVQSPYNQTTSELERKLDSFDTNYSYGYM